MSIAVTKREEQTIRHLSGYPVEKFPIILEAFEQDFPRAKEAVDSKS